MSDPVISYLKEKAECDGKRESCTADGCPLYGTPTRPARDGKVRVRGCKDPVARGKRNRSSGDAKARAARKALQIQGANSRHEETWAGALRIEVKSGKVILPVWTAYLRCEAQSEQSRSIGDNRPFAAVFVPQGSTEAVVAFRLSKATEVAVAILENFGGAA